jgi:FemAB-related protein (PEP-CTERM system-associated)
MPTVACLERSPAHVDPDVHISVSTTDEIPAALARWRRYAATKAPRRPLSLDPGWLTVLARGLRHTPYVLEARSGDATCGLLPLAYVRSLLFGRYLVGLPYLNYGGVLADDEAISAQLIERAISLADELNVRHLELRHEELHAHPALAHARTDKVNVRLELPDSSTKLWSKLSAKVRNQVRKAQKNDLTVAWGGRELLRDFYSVFASNMRDLGTPVYGKRLFRAILAEFPERSEFCIVRAGRKPIAAGLLLHGWGITEVPSASSLRRYNATCANMLLYWHLLERAVERGQQVFDFGRSSRDGATHRFKKQWGGQAVDANWQYYVRSGCPQDARRDNPRFSLFIRLWQRLPVFLTRLIGPPIVRGIP